VAGFERGDDGVGIVDAVAPGPAADGLQEGGPEAGVGGEVRVGREARVGRAPGEDARPSLRAELDAVGADQVHRAFKSDAVDDDPDQVANSVIAAINQGHVYRYLSKPWQPEELEAAVADAAAEYSRIVQQAQELTKCRERIAQLEQENQQLRKLSKDKM
jgi:hypothetical protein